MQFENLDNLTTLWKRYGVDEVYADEQMTIFANKSWPHRCWREYKGNPNIFHLDMVTNDTNRLFDLAPSNAVLPIWFSNDGKTDASDGYVWQQNWQKSFSQTAMFLPINNIESDAIDTKSSLEMHTVSTDNELDSWIDVCQQAFGYSVNKDVIKTVMDSDEVSILLGALDGKPALTCLLFKSKNVIGLHQFGVSPAFQGRGLAKKAMLNILNQCKQTDAEHVVLQASVAGFPLYKKLGFQTSFAIENYRSSENYKRKLNRL